MTRLASTAVAGFATGWSLLALISELFLSRTGQPAWLIGAALVFAGFAWIAIIRHDSVPARVFALFCCGMTLAFGPAPWMGPGWLQLLAGLARSAVIFASIAAALHFVILVPWGNRRHQSPSLAAIYLPVACAWLLVALRTQLDRSDHPLLNVFMLAVIGMCLAGYVILATIAFLRRYIRSEPHQRKNNGTRAMLLGTLAGAVPGLLAGFTLLGRAPGARYLMASAVLLPVSWYGVMRKMAASGGAQDRDGSR